MESISTFEQEPHYTSKIKLHFMRHAEKAGSNVTEDALDRRLPLTLRGKKQAREKASASTVSQTLAIASSRDRAKETALFALAGKTESITGTETLKELREKVDASLSYGSKLLVDERLDMPFAKMTPYHMALDKAYEEGRYFQTLAELHDRVVERQGEDTESTYAEQARNVAAIIKKYASIVPRWNELVDEDSSKSYSDTLERILASHGSVGESFLADVIERLHGKAERDKFIAAIPNGLEFAEGFDVDVLYDATRRKTDIRVSIALGSAASRFIFSETFSEQLLDEIRAAYSSEKR